jgi:hypothetical protein
MEFAHTLGIAGKPLAREMKRGESYSKDFSTYYNVRFK